MTIDEALDGLIYVYELKRVFLKKTQQVGDYPSLYPELFLMDPNTGTSYYIPNKKLKCHYVKLHCVGDLVIAENPQLWVTLRTNLLREYSLLPTTCTWAK